MDKTGRRVVIWTQKTETSNPIAARNLLGSKRRSGNIALIFLPAFLFCVRAHALPNLTPYQPPGWSDKIVVSRTSGSTIDSTGLTTADSLYVDWAVVNNGTTATGSGFYDTLYIDGVVWAASYYSSSLTAGFYIDSVNNSIGSLSAGTHTITIVADSGLQISESNENDNSYTKTITISTPGQPNLAPYQPPGWSDKIVVSRTSGSTTDSTGLTTADSLYVDWAIINNGTTATGSGFYDTLYIDGVVWAASYYSSSLTAGFYIYSVNNSIGSLSAGTHTITIVADSGLQIAESNESDNSYAKTITISNPSQPNLTPYQPSGWSDKIVVARTSSSTTDSTSLTTADTLYVNSAVINSGTAATAVNFNSELYVDGMPTANWVTDAPLDVNSYSSLTSGYSIGQLSAGTHTIEITVDYGGVIAESNEGDNSYTKTITVSSALPNLTPYQPTGWSDKIVVTKTANSTTDSTALTTADTLYVNWSVINNGTAATAVNFNSELYVDGVPTANWVTDAPLGVNAYSSLPSGYSIGQLSEGSHTIKVTVDYGGVITESNEGDNSYSKTITVSAANPPAGLTIVPIFDSSIVNDGQSATIEATINAAIAVYKSRFSDPVTVSILFQKVATGVGASQKSYISVLYSDYIAALASHATSTDDAIALLNLPKSPANPVNNSQTVNLNCPLGRALGFQAQPSGQDGTILLNISDMNVSSTQNDPTKYSLFSVVSHEIDEVLGFGSVLNGLNNGDPSPTVAIMPEDLFRYDQNGHRSFTTGVNAVSFFSLDGTSDLAQFNQYDGGVDAQGNPIHADFADWYSIGGHTPQVQDAFSTPGATPVLGVELRCLDVIGFTLIPDTQGPAVVIDSPSQNTTVISSSLSVSGTATDNGYGNDGVGSVTVNGISAAGGSASGGSTAYWSANIVLNPGANTVTVVAKDNANNSSQQQITVTYNPPDMTPPNVTINAPASGQTFTTSPITVDGVASDLGNSSTGVSLVQVQINGTGGTWAAAAGTANWSASVALAPGANTIYARSQDGAGNYSTIASVSVIYNPPDTTPPSVTTVFPTSDPAYPTSNGTVSLAGTASDNVGVTSVTWTNQETGGSGTANGTTSWTVNSINLQPGTNVIAVTAYDAAGNSQNAILVVVYAPSYVLPATLTNTTISNGFLVFGLNAPPSAYTIQASSDLISWTNASLNSVVVTNGVARITIPIQVNQPHLFYRASQGFSGSLTNQLISYWKMDGNSADSVGANGGANTAVTYLTNNGKIGGYAEFNGSTSGITTSIANTSANFSLSFWFRTSSSPVQNLVIVTDSTTSTTTTAIGATIGSISGSVRFGGGHVIDSLGIYNDGHWHHCVCTQTGTSGVLYLDGVAVTRGTVDLMNFTYYVRMGTGLQFTAAMNGDLDEVGLWSRVLTATEVSQLWNGGNGAYP